MHIVIRGWGNADYLIGLNEEWGTVCAGDATKGAGRHKALRFPTALAARAGARKARRACLGWNGVHKVRARHAFRAIEIAELESA